MSTTMGVNAKVENEFAELQVQLTQQTVAINEAIEVTRDTLDKADSAKAKQAAEREQALEGQSASLSTALETMRVQYEHRVC